MKRILLVMLSLFFLTLDSLVLCGSESISRSVSSSSNQAIFDAHNEAQVSANPFNVLIREPQNWYCQGDTPLHAALRNADLTEAIRLVDDGADVRIANSVGLCPLHLAAVSERYLGLLRRIIIQGADVNSRDNFGRTSLYLASEEGNVPALEELLRRGALPNITAQGRNTALHVAAYFGHADIIELLLSRGAEIDAINSQGATALHSAIQQGHANCVRALVARGAGRNVRIANGRAPIHFAVLNNDVVSLRALLPDGDGCNLYIVNQADQVGRSALHMAAQQDYEDCLELLLVNYAKLEAVDRNGDTPLLTAVRSESVRCLRKLLEKGASTVVINERAMTIFHLVAEWGNAQSLRILTEYAQRISRLKVDMTALDAEGKTALHVAAENNHAACIRVLAEAGVDLDARSANGWTAVHWASAFGNVDAIETLVELGADCMVRSAGGRTALHVAVEKNQVNSIITLIRGQRSEAARKALIEASLISGKRALHLAADSGLVECIDALVMWGAEVDVQTREGINPLQIASIRGHTDSVEKLMSLGASVTVRTQNGKTALQLARENGMNECAEKIQHQLIEELWIAAGKGDVQGIRLLLAAGANIDGLSSFGMTSLHEAARYNKIDILRALLNANARRYVSSRTGETAFQIAAHFGHSGCVRELAVDGNLDAVRADGQTELHHAVVHNRIQVVRGLLAAGAQLDVRDASGMTALHWAAHRGHTDCIAVLLGRGADVNLVSADGRTAVHYGAQNNQLEVVRALLVANANRELTAQNGLTPLQTAAHFGHLGCVKALAIGGNVNGTNADGNLNALRADGQTELHYAVVHNRIQIVRGLLAAGARVDVYNNQGKLPLYCAVDLNLFDSVQALLDAGASMNAKDDRDTGVTAFQHAVRNNRAILIDEFIRRGVVVNTKDTSGMTALHWAAHAGHTDCIAILLANGAEINHVSGDGRSAVHYGAQNNQLGAVRALLAAHANRELAAHNGFTPLQTAAHFGHVGCVKALAIGGNVNGTAVDGNLHALRTDGQTELHRAVLDNRIQVVRGLLAAGARTDIYNNQGKTPLYCAVDLNRLDFVKALLDAGALMNVKDDRDTGIMAFHLAARNNREAIVDEFIRRGVRTDSFVTLQTAGAAHSHTSTDGRTALHFAAENGYEQLVRNLLRAGSLANWIDATGCTPLHYAAQNGHDRCVNALIEGQGHAYINSRSHDGRTPLACAAMNNRLRVVQKLLEVSADRTIVDTNGYTPLQAAALFGHSACVRALAIGGNVNGTNADGNLNALRADGQTELHRAILDNRIRVVLGLLAAGARWDTYNHQGKSPLYCAVEHNRLDSVKALLDAGASMTFRDDRDAGITAFQYAAHNKRDDIVDEFILRHVSVNTYASAQDSGSSLVSSDGRTALHFAAQAGHAGIVRKLLAAGAGSQFVDKFGLTALHYAALHGRDDCITALLEGQGRANINLSSSDGRTPLQCAINNNHQGAIEVLKNAGGATNLSTGEKFLLGVGAVAGGALLGAGLGVVLSALTAKTAIVAATTIAATTLSKDEKENRAEN